MSRSYRKAYDTLTSVKAGSMKRWRKETNRKIRRVSKQAIKTCEDYDELILPCKKGYANLYDSPHDGGKILTEKPLLNECYFYIKESLEQGYYSYAEYLSIGHLPKCKCYVNPNCEYRKLIRK